MELPPEIKSRRLKKLAGGRSISSYPHNLQFYSQPPTDQISLQEFEDFSIDRLKVLKAVEAIGVRHVKTTEEYKTAMQTELKKLGVHISSSTQNEEDLDSTMLTKIFDERRMDHVSHFILRLAYCRSEDLRRWFIQQEVDLFRFRFGIENEKSIKKFLKLNNLNYEPIDDIERGAIYKELNACRAQSGVVEGNKYYKVPFTEALDLVKNRRVFLSRGQAYVPHQDLVVIILTAFRAHLSHALAVTSRAVPQLEEDNRLLPMLSHLSKRYLGQDYGNSKKTAAGAVTADMIETLNKQSFPLCMQNLHQGLRKDHHLRHWGRMQYGLFLKAIGLSLEEALKFWRAEFTKVMDVDKFDKQYAYNIRHNYGKEGKRADYTPYSCVKIITTNHPAVGDHHGCPFRHTDADLLRQRLQGLRISKDGVDEIVDNVKSHNYQIACARYFELTHQVSRDTVNINHPNQYYEESVKALSAEKDGATPAKKSGGVTLVKVGQKSSQVSGSQGASADSTANINLTNDQMNSLFDSMEQ